MSFILALLCFFAEALCEEAVIIVPVADTLLQPVDVHVQAATYYNSLPCMGEQGFKGCKRAHQCLFNEVVSIVQYRGDEVQVAVKNTFYGYHDVTGEPLNNFWILRSNIMTYEDLHNFGIDVDVFPSPIDYKNKESLCNQNIITLVLPWYDKVTDRTYSVGTRFVRLQELDTKDAYGIKMIHPHKNRVVESIIPCSHGLMSVCTKSDSCKLLIKLLSIWIDYAQKRKEAIAYVWGGSSLVDTYKEQDILIEKKPYKEDMVTCWNRNGQKPYTGFDCSELILRACQIVGIPYFYKNSYLAAQNLRALGEYDEIEEGDIIWIQGHLMIVSNCEKNEIIEAAGYHKGYGDVHILPVSKIFAGISTLEHLKRSFLNHEPIHILDHDGIVFETRDKFMILKLASVWKE